MNVLHLQLTGNPGGIVSLCRSIAKKSSNTNYIYFLFSGGTVTDEMEKESIPIHVAYANRIFWIKSIIELIKFCKEKKIDVIINHSNSFISCTHALCVKKVLTSVKLIGYLHSDPFDMINRTKYKIIYKQFIISYFKKTSVVIAISEFVKGRGIEEFNLPYEKIKVVYNGVECDRFSQLPKKDYSKKETMELIYVGRIIREKGISLLVESLAKVNIPVHINIVGDGTDYDKVVKLCDDLGVNEKITFLGIRMDIPELLQNADFFIHPAIWNEGFGITLIEAMAAGVPCVAFKKGAIPEIISDRKNGLIIDEVSVDKLGQAINRCYEIYCSDEYSSYREAAFKSVQKFDITNMISQLESNY